VIALSRTDVGRSIEARLRSAFPEVRLTLELRELAPRLELEDCGQVELVRDRFVVELGFPAGTCWRALDETLAEELLTSLLAFDLAYDSARVESPMPVAKNLAGEFLALFESAPRLFTNADLTRRLLPHRPAHGAHFVPQDWRRPEQYDLPRPDAYDSLTSATFACGVVVMAHQRIGCLWVEDED
jgi:hypothetical protein